MTNKHIFIYHTSIFLLKAKRLYLRVGAALQVMRMGRRLAIAESDDVIYE